MDFTQSADGSYVKVRCLVETIVGDKGLQPGFKLMKVGQLFVTPFHPVKTDEGSGWQFPIDISNEYISASSVFNLILESRRRHNTVVINGAEAITFGHGITNSTILEHVYFRVIKLLLTS